jgi:hypothetical protein
MRTNDLAGGYAGQADASVVGSFQGLLRRISSNIDLLSSLIDGVDHAASLVENRPAPLKSVEGKDAPQAMLTLSRLDADLEHQINRLRELIPQIT